MTDPSFCMWSKFRLNIRPNLTSIVICIPPSWKQWWIWVHDLCSHFFTAEKMWYWSRTKTTFHNAWFWWNIREDLAFLAVYVVDLQGNLVSLILAFRAEYPVAFQTKGSKTGQKEKEYYKPHYDPVLHQTEDKLTNQSTHRSIFHSPFASQHTFTSKVSTKRNRTWDMIWM